MQSIGSDCPPLESAEPASVAEIWDFLARCRFLYAEKLSLIDVAGAQATWAALQGARALSATCVVRKDGSMRAHANAVALYQHTWALQHLSALLDAHSGLTRGQEVSVAMLTLLRERPEAEWLKIFYRPQNRFADRVFGGFARSVEHPDTSCSRVFEYCVSANDADVGHARDLSSDGEPPCVRAADAADREAFEREFLRELPAALRAADDLHPDELDLSSLSHAYAALGLERRRELLVALRSGKVVGGALLELSSPGLNLSELTSSFRVFARDPAVTRALIVSARVRYRELGRARSVGLADAEQRATFEALGFVFKRRYACWTWHRSLIDALDKHIREAGK